MQGDPGNGSYITTLPLAPQVGQSITHPLSSLVAPEGRAVQLGDVVFSTVSQGVLASVQSISTTAPYQVTLMTRQVYGKEALKALLDTELHVVAAAGTGLEQIGTLWTLSKNSVPLPPGYNYEVGDFVFSHSRWGSLNLNYSLVLSLIEEIQTNNLRLRTKILLPVTITRNDILQMLEGYVPSTRTINNMPLTSNLTLTEDTIPAGATNAKFTNSEKSKLTGLPTGAALTSSLAGKAATNHTHEMSQVNGLPAALANKVESPNIDILWHGTLAQYNAISPKLNNTLYFIKG